MGLGIPLGSIVSAVADKTGDDSIDATVKIKRLVNEKGPDFCEIANFPFLRSDISFTITTAACKYSGASYLPTTFKRIAGAHLVDSNGDWHNLTEVSISERYTWPAPVENSGRPDKFCITRIESGYWEIEFNRYPDASYTFEADIELQWSDVTATSDETVISKRYFPQFSHFVSMARYIQQGDTENYVIADKEWHDPSSPGKGMLDRLLRSLGNPLRKKRVIMSENYLNPFGSRKSDYDTRG